MLYHYFTVIFRKMKCLRISERRGGKLILYYVMIWIILTMVVKTANAEENRKKLRYMGLSEHGRKWANPGISHDDRQKPKENVMPPTGSAEKRLTKSLVHSYKRMGIEGRPVINSTQSMEVMFGLNMMQMDLDERENTLSTSVWSRIRWKDEYLRWDPADYDGIGVVRMSSKKIWIPDIMLYNTADTQVMERDVLVVVKYDGSMLWIPHRIYRSSCKVDVTHFPFDQQRCQMTFGSWAYNGKEINLQFHDDFERMDLSDLERENTEWEVLAKQETRLEQMYDCCEDPYVTLIFTIAMKRKLVFSSFILTLPCIFLACMTLVVFWLPPERPDRTSLAMNLFSCFLLLLLILVEAAPPTASSVPTLGVYYCFNMVLIMLSIFLSSMVININRKGEAKEQVPSWLYKISINCLGRIFCIQLLRARNFLDVKKMVAQNPGNSHTGSVLANQQTVYTSIGPRGSHFHLLQPSDPSNQQNYNQSNATNHNSINAGTQQQSHPHHHHNSKRSSTKSNDVSSTMYTTNRSESATGDEDNSTIYYNQQPSHVSNQVADHHQSSYLNNPQSTTRNNEGPAPLSESVISVLDILQNNNIDNKTYKALKTHFIVLEKSLKKVEKNTREILLTMRDSAHKKEVRLRRLEWQIVAATIDRVLFIIFFFAIVSSLLTLFPRPYQLQHAQ